MGIWHFQRNRMHKAVNWKDNVVLKYYTWISDIYSLIWFNIFPLTFRVSRTRLPFVASFFFANRTMASGNCFHRKTCRSDPRYRTMPPCSVCTGGVLCHLLALAHQHPEKMAHLHRNTTGTIKGYFLKKSYFKRHPTDDGCQMVINNKANLAHKCHHIQSCYWAYVQRLSQHHIISVGIWL